MTVVYITSTSPRVFEFKDEDIMPESKEIFDEKQLFPEEAGRLIWKQWILIGELQKNREKIQGGVLTITAFSIFFYNYIFFS